MVTDIPASVTKLARQAFIARPAPRILACSDDKKARLPNHSHCLSRALCFADDGVEHGQHEQPGRKAHPQGSSRGEPLTHTHASSFGTSSWAEEMHPHHHIPYPIPLPSLGIIRCCCLLLHRYQRRAPTSTLMPHLWRTTSLSGTLRSEARQGLHSRAAATMGASPCRPSTRSSRRRSQCSTPAAASPSARRSASPCRRTIPSTGSPRGACAPSSRRSWPFFPPRLTARWPGWTTRTRNGACSRVRAATGPASFAVSAWTQRCPRRPTPPTPPAARVRRRCPRRPLS